MKIGRKGFMLAEVVVVAVVIATVLVTMFAGLNNISSAYEVRNRYYDVDSLYVAMEYNDILIRDNVIDSLDKNRITILFDLCSDMNAFVAFYKNSVKYNIVSYFVPYDSDKLDELKNEDINQTFKDYIDYLSDNLIFEDDYDYMIIVERENIDDEDDCYYYALKLKY